MAADPVSLDKVVQGLQTAKNIIVIAGAGISTSLGIPDFRSGRWSLYPMMGDKVAKHGLSDPQQVFDKDVFHDDPEIFYEFANRMLPRVKGVSLAHKFLYSLYETGRLRRVYTQNVDGLELRAHIPNTSVVQMHGTMESFSCLKCKYRISSPRATEDVVNGRIPHCERCVEAAREEAATKRRTRKIPARVQPKRKVRKSWEEIEDQKDDEAKSIIAQAVLKPNIVFFGEPLPEMYHDHVNQDLQDADFVLVMGTSLSVKPASGMIDVLPESTSKVWINRDMSSLKTFNTQLIGPCDVIARELGRRAGFEINHPLVKEIEEVFVDERGEGVYKFDWIVEGEKLPQGLSTDLA